MAKQEERYLEEIKNGYREEANGYRCSFCEQLFEKGEIFNIDGRFFDAERAVKIHICKQHGSVFDRLMETDKKQNGLTDVQKQLLRLMKEGNSDKEIAKITSTSASTVRHQRFVFKEKAKQARLFLAMYELALEQAEQPQEEKLVEVHMGANMIDDRFITTVAESDQILSAMFASFEPLKLKQFPGRDKKKIVVLRRITEGLDYGRHYSEQEINAYLKEIYSDFVTIRRALIEYGFLMRTEDCSEYWVKGTD